MGVLSDLWSERRLRRSIVADLQPLFEQSRLQHGEEIEVLWSSDYGVGLIAMVVLLAVRRSDPDLGSESLGRLQAACWADLTGLDSVDLGTRITLLSAGNDPKFGDGCRAAIAYDAALRAEGSGDESAHLGQADIETVNRAAARRDLWDRMWQAG